MFKTVNYCRIEGVHMNARRPQPIGPSAIALRHMRFESGNRVIAVLAVILGVALLGGIVLLVA